LLASPLYARSIYLLSPLFIYLYRLCIGTYSFHGWKRDPKFLRVGEVVPPNKHIKPFDLGFLV